MKFLTTALILTSALAAGAASAQQGPGCVTSGERGANAPPQTCGPTGVGQIVSAEQPVSVIRQAAVLRLGAGSALTAGDRILVRGAHTATISLGGSCAFTITSRATAILANSGGRLCVTEQLPGAATPASNVSGVPAGGATSGLGVSTYVGAGIVGAGAIAGGLLLNQGDKRQTISQPAVNN